MKKAKLKIDYFTCSSDATIKDIFKKGDILTYDKKLKMYYRKETNSLSTYPEIFIEKNTDIFEIFEEPEPQEEVIEGYAWERQEGKYHFVKPDQPIIEGAIDSILILNPQKTDIEKYKKALHILGSIWFYGDFKAETPNEKELEKIMIELGYKYKSGTAVFLGNPNPKKKKEKEQYTFILHNEIIKKFRQSYCLSKTGEYSNHIPCTLIRNKGAENNHTKIKITVEEE